MDETKIIYHIDDEDTPYLIKLSIPADKVTLGDFKNALNRPNYKFFFKSMDDDFGVVKEEIIDEEAKLPCFNGRVVSWLVAADNSTSDNASSTGTESNQGQDMPPQERVGGIGDSRPPSFHANAGKEFDNLENDSVGESCTDTESLLSNRRATDRNVGSPRGNHNQGYKDNRYHYNDRHHGPHAKQINGHLIRHERPARDRGHGYETASSFMSSDIDSTSYFDSEDDNASRFSTETGTTSRSSKYGRHRRRRRRHRLPPISRASSFSSITDSTMSLNIITVTLNMDKVNFLGISIVGQSNKGGDGGIYVGSIMKGGAVAQDGRVEPGDMILEVNGVSFENMSNDDAVRALREAVQKPGPITLVVAKCWDPNPKGYFTIPRQEPVRPIDPSAWVAHTAAMRGDYPRGPGSVSTVTTSTDLTSSLGDPERFDELNLSIETDMLSVVRAMAQPDSGLEIRDRMWLKIRIPNAFMGSDLVDWLHTHVEGFLDRRDARKYACNLLKAGYIRHTVNKITFSEQCYYIFGDLYGAGDNAKFGIYGLPDMGGLSLNNIDSVSEADQDTLAPLPPPAWNNYYQYPPQYVPPHFSYSQDGGSCHSYPLPGGNGSAGSQHSGSGSSHSGSGKMKKEKNKEKSGGSSSGSETDAHSVASVRRGAASERSFAPSERSLPPPPVELLNANPEMSGSRQSFRMAMGNPSEQLNQLDQL